ncbi:MAG: porin PorA family protein [Frankiaceae bacterium]
MRRLSADRGASLPGVILVVVGVLLVAAAGTLKWVIVPSQTKLPSNLNVNLAIDGTYSGINNAALKKGDLADLRLANAPITFYWSVQAQRSQGDSLLVSDARQIVLKSDGTHLADQAFAYSMDGKTVQLNTTFTGDYMLNFPQVDPRNPTPAAQTVKILNPPPNGVTINFPFRTPKSQLTGYNVYTQRACPVTSAQGPELRACSRPNPRSDLTAFSASWLVGGLLGARGNRDQALLISDQRS